MLNKYYYLVASLPYLELEKRPPIPRDEFLSQCAKWLDAGDLGGISKIDISDITAKREDAEIIKEWKAFDLSLRGELAEIRQARKGGGREKVPEALKDLFEEPTPLFMERRLEKKRWDFLEEKEFGYHFDINTLSLYFLKLQILERLAKFEKERGIDIFEKLCEVRLGGLTG
jgi:hypothetical protein